MSLWEKNTKYNKTQIGSKHTFFFFFPLSSYDTASYVNQSQGQRKMIISETMML